jgi:hypothetical protein
MDRGKFLALLGVAAIILAIGGWSGPAAAQVEQWETFQGWIVAIGPDHVELNVRGFAMGGENHVRVLLTETTRFESPMMADVAVVVLAYRQQGAWYAASIAAARDG